MRSIVLTLLTLVMTAFLFTGAKAEKRVALVIGNSSYTQISALSNPRNDAELMSRSLTALGFDVVLITDANRQAMGRAIRTFGRKLRTAGKDAVGVFYYAGHGVQARGANYLIPVGALLEDHADFSIEALSAADVLKQMESAGNRLNLVILDACRNNPFKSKVRGNRRGLARIEAASGTMVAFSAAPGQTAEDGTGKNSTYTAALVSAMQIPGLTVEHVFKRVRVQVEKETVGRQTPWEESSLLGDFYFTPAKATAAVPELAVKPAAPVQSSDRSAWAVIQETNSKAVLQAFIKQFPNSLYTTFARARLSEMEATSPSEPPKQRETEDQDDQGRLASVAVEAETQLEADPDLPRKIQTALRNAGCSPGKIDGQWGSNSKAALERFARYAKLRVPQEPLSEDTLGLFENLETPVCPVTCGPRQVESNGRCIARTCPAGYTLTSSGKCRIRQKKQATIQSPANISPKVKRQNTVTQPTRRKVFQGENSCAAGLASQC